jgi:hypothetical protein
MQANILIFFAGFACGLLVLTALETLTLDRVRALAFVVWDALVYRFKKIKGKIYARTK